MAGPAETERQLNFAFTDDKRVTANVRLDPDGTIPPSYHTWLVRIVDMKPVAFAWVIFDWHGGGQEYRLQQVSEFGPVNL